MAPRSGTGAHRRTRPLARLRRTDPSAARLHERAGAALGAQRWLAGLHVHAAGELRAAPAVAGGERSEGLGAACPGARERARGGGLAGAGAADRPGAGVEAPRVAAVEHAGDRGVLPGAPQWRVIWAQVQAKPLGPPAEAGTLAAGRHPNVGGPAGPTSEFRPSKRRPSRGRSALATLRGLVAGGGRNANPGGYTDRVPRAAGEVAAAACMCVTAARTRRPPQAAQMRPCAGHAPVGPP